MILNVSDIFQIEKDFLNYEVVEDCDVNVQKVPNYLDNNCNDN